MGSYNSTPLELDFILEGTAIESIQKKSPTILIPSPMYTQNPSNAATKLLLI